MEKGNYENSITLNIWEDQDYSTVCFADEISNSSKFILFLSNKPIQEISKQWTLFFNKIKYNKSILGNNCAFATNHVIKNILDINYEKYAQITRVFAFLYLRYWV